MAFVVGFTLMFAFSFFIRNGELLKKKFPVSLFQIEREKAIKIVLSQLLLLLLLLALFLFSGSAIQTVKIA